MATAAASNGHVALLINDYHSNSVQSRRTLRSGYFRARGSLGLGFPRAGFFHPSSFRFIQSRPKISACAFRPNNCREIWLNWRKRRVLSACWCFSTSINGPEEGQGIGRHPSHPSFLVHNVPIVCPRLDRVVTNSITASLRMRCTG